MLSCCGSLRRVWAWALSVSYALAAPFGSGTWWLRELWGSTLPVLPCPSSLRCITLKGRASTGFTWTFYVVSPPDAQEVLLLCPSPSAPRSHTMSLPVHYRAYLRARQSIQDALVPHCSVDCKSPRTVVAIVSNILDLLGQASGRSIKPTSPSLDLLPTTPRAACLTRRQRSSTLMHSVWIGLSMSRQQSSCSHCRLQKSSKPSLGRSHLACCCWASRQLMETTTRRYAELAMFATLVPYACRRLCLISM
jgi:hypothetical protein